MKMLRKFGLAALAVALSASASAFPYSVSQRNPPLPPGNGPTIAVFVRGQGVGQFKQSASGKEIVQPIRQASSPHWR